MRQIKTLDPSARVLGLDVGRKYTGVALSDPQLLFAKPLKTINQLTDQLGMEGDIREVARQLNNIIRSKNVKGLIVGYPLDDKMMPTRHCNYIEEFINQLNWNGQLRSPVTLINEYGSSVEAKAQIASRVNLVNFVQLTQMRQQMEQQLLETGGQVQPSISPTVDSLLMEPSVMLRKGIYDKVAAKIVLQKYLDFHHSEDDQLIL